VIATHARLVKLYQERAAAVANIDLRAVLKAVLVINEPPAFGSNPQQAPVMNTSHDRVTMFHRTAVELTRAFDMPIPGASFADLRLALKVLQGTAGSTADVNDGQFRQSAATSGTTWTARASPSRGSRDWGGSSTRRS
jgi:hypothetical protein